MTHAALKTGARPDELRKSQRQLRVIDLEDAGEATVERFGGRFLVRGGEPKAIDGGGFASRVIVIEFDSPEQVMVWYNCLDYPAIVAIRNANSKTRAARRIGA
jgi:uncharacterized protein (DUF1330 family)